VITPVNTEKFTTASDFDSTEIRNRQTPPNRAENWECADASGPTHIRVCSSWNDLEVFQKEWNHLLATAPGISIFSTPEWLASWWRAYGVGKELRALLFFAPDGELVGLAPLYIERCTVLGRKLRLLRLVGDGSGDSDNLDFVVRPGYGGACIGSFLLWLQRGEWDLCALATLPESSVFGGNLLRYLRSSGWPVLERHCPHLSVFLPESWECYLRQLNPQFRPLLTRYPRRLKARHQVRVYRSTKADLEKDLSSLFSLHEMRWRERGQAGVFVNPDRRRFYQELGHSLLIRERLEFWLMDLDGTTVAAQFCLRFGKTVYLLQEGFDPQYAQEKVGYALRAEMFQDLIRRGIQRYDFLAGRDPYKVRFGAEESSYVTVEFARPATLGSAYLALKRFDLRARRWAHDNLPEPAIRMLRRAVYRADGHQ
jgi:CelD/BcsL family acetyltransferase involved in cellulose biosynthesis